MAQSRKQLRQRIHALETELWNRPDMISLDGLDNPTKTDISDKFEIAMRASQPVTLSVKYQNVTFTFGLARPLEISWDLIR